MTIGENIQRYRKQLGLSQEELGQKLLVSRQTVSLWENDQTIPTIDNLIRLREIFNVPVDAILGVRIKQNEPTMEPNEIYRYSYTDAEWNDYFRLQHTSLVKKFVTLLLVNVLFLLLLIATSAPDIICGFLFGVIGAGISGHCHTIRAHKKLWKETLSRVSNSTYDYAIYDTYIIVNIHRGNDKVRETKCYFTDIEKMSILDKWLVFVHSGQAFILRRDELKENSALYSYMYHHPVSVPPAPGKWKSLSIFLFVASILSLPLSLPIIGATSEWFGSFTENMWICYVMTPVPIASIVVGYVLKAKNYRYKKNVIVGFIMTALLCIYGSFIFLS